MLRVLHLDPVSCAGCCPRPNPQLTVRRRRRRIRLSPAAWKRLRGGCPMVDGNGWPVAAVRLGKSKLVPQRNGHVCQADLSTPSVMVPCPSVLHVSGPVPSVWMARPHGKGLVSREGWSIHYVHLDFVALLSNVYPISGKPYGCKSRTDVYWKSFVSDGQI